MQHEPGARHRVTSRRSFLRRGLVIAGGVGVAAVAGTAAVVIPSRLADSSAQADRMPTGAVESEGTRWIPYLAEDFDQDSTAGRLLAVYPKMAEYTGIHDTSGKGLYSPDQVVSVHDSTLDFHLHSSGAQPLVASVLPAGYRSYVHQRVSIRYRADTVPGYKFVMILWPLSGDWNEGEIDWPEGDLTGDVRPVSAIPGSYDPKSGKMTFLPQDPTSTSGGQTDWHTATVEWTADAVRFWWDGKLLETVTGAVPTTPMRVTLQAETSIDDKPVPTDAAGHVLVDWVVAYRQSGAAAS
ncbi:glycoside hydrolase family 16 protein [Curtobacterium sp. ISL-83]|uniref:glycoside hydrolase family 16 protein n=1 Tax=Curtobacterium sp. ISL-83 TaxID=2819145 RepID=UPI001BE77931|nr:glycoside hydrolase family 16 protein [Curtobacterium sp. ISL-83]MBT2501655.1 glycoside hydrolase family 16 protein [Curtobacterium sp. ISL-83]